MARRKGSRWIEYRRLEDVVGADRNPKRHVDLNPSFERFAFTEAVLVDERTGKLVAGHGRTAALRARRDRGEGPPEGILLADDGSWLVPVTRGWSSADADEAEAYLVASNRLVEAGGMDLEEMVAVLSDLAGGPGLEGVGYDERDLSSLISTLTNRRKRAARGERPMPDAQHVRSGQVWDVGPHRLVVGDGREPDVWTAIPECAALVTDPPYGIAYDGGAGADDARAPIDGDESPEAAAALLEAVLPNVVAHLPAGAPSFTCLPSGPALLPLMQVLDRFGLYRWMLVWAKDRATLGRGDFHAQHEEVAFGQFDLEDAAGHVAYSWVPGAARIHPVADRRATSLLAFDRPSANPDHPTEKPVPLMEHLIGLVTDPGDLVLDPFAGSGSTLVAAARSGRRGVGIELRPEYGRVILGRLSAVVEVDPVQLAG